jgi:cobalt-zinc-cadmium efflux system membrane fusion protein
VKINASIIAVCLAACCGCGGGLESVPSRAEAHTAAPEPGRISVPPGSPKLKRIRVAPVGLRAFPLDEVAAPGKVETNPNRISKVAAPVAGRIRQVFVRLGDSVREGQPLFEIDSAEAGAALAQFRQAASQSRTAKSALAKAEADLARVEDLHEHRAAALKDVLAARNDLTQAQAGVEQAEAAQHEAEHRLELLDIDPASPSALITVRAPIAGKLLEIGVTAGEYRNDTSAPLMTIADLRTVWISADVPESQIRLIDVGEAIEVELSAYPGEKFRARVARIADLVDPQTRAVKVQAEIENPAGRLRPEMFGLIRHTHSVAPIPAIPAAAVVEREGRTVALVEQAPGEFRSVDIAVGPRQGEFVPVKAGLKPGDRVVVDGPMLLEKR